MRVNARLDDVTQQQLNYLTQATGQSVSQVVRESVAQYFVQVKQQQVPSRFLALAGQWGRERSGHSPAPATGAMDVKTGVTEALRAKYPQHFGPATHSPAGTHAAPRRATSAGKKPRP